VTVRICPECDARTEQAICPKCGSRTLRDLKKDDDRSDPMLGRVLDERYRIESLIGRGGMGAVCQLGSTILWHQATWSGMDTGFHVLGLAAGASTTSLFEDGTVLGSVTEDLSSGNWSVSIFNLTGPYTPCNGHGELQVDWFRVRRFAEGAVVGMVGI
jgi:ribosomal protein L40E